MTFQVVENGGGREKERGTGHVRLESNKGALVWEGWISFTEDVPLLARL